jgi:soluble lytic murein transglycosylase-like protein
MKKIILINLAILLCMAAPSLAQTTSGHYCYDNFDTARGVQIAVPAPAVITRALKKGRAGAKSANTARSSSSSNVQLTSLIYAHSPVTMTASASLDGFTTGNAKVDQIIVEAGARNGVDPVLLYATMHQESSFKPLAISPKGARGLMQLMPATAARFGVKDIFDPRQNIEGGARYIRFLLDIFGGDVQLALAGYNAGEGAVLKFGRTIPPYRETQEYVRRITQRYTLMRDPLVARKAHTVSGAELAAVRNEQSAPLTIYERNVSAVRLPDGRLILISQ